MGEGTQKKHITPIETQRKGKPAFIGDPDGVLNGANTHVTPESTPGDSFTTRRKTRNDTPPDDNEY